MPLVTRYIIWELLKVFLCALGSLTGLLLLLGVAQEAINHGLGPLPILRMMPYIVPDALRFSVPATMLLACCTVYGRMSAMNEIVAVKSLGISPRTMMWPALGIAFVISLVGVWLNDIAVSWGHDGVRRVVIQSVEEIAYGMLRTRRTFTDDKFSINVKGVEGRRLICPTVTFLGDDEGSSVVLAAAEAELRFIPEESSLSILLIDGTVDVDGKATAHLPDHFEQVVPLGDKRKMSPDAQSRPSEVPLWRMNHEIEEQRREIEEIEKQFAVEFAYDLATGEFATLHDEIWTPRRNALRGYRIRLFRLQTEPWRRWANGFSCICFCIVGVPLAVLLRKGDYLTTFFLCFLPILIMYYPLVAFGVDRAKTGALPPYAVWLGNVIAIAIGLWLMRRVEKH